MYLPSQQSPLPRCRVPLSRGVNDLRKLSVKLRRLAVADEARADLSVFELFACRIDVDAPGPALLGIQAEDVDIEKERAVFQRLVLVHVVFAIGDRAGGIGHLSTPPIM